MAKSFKRAIACLLAVLMVAFSMPFTALAAAGDYEPDIEIYFYPIYTDGLGNYEGVAGSKKGVDPSVGAGSLSDVAFDFKNGTLSVTPDKYADYLDYNEMGADEVGVFGEDGTETWTLGEGDFFGAVVVCKNISELYAISGAISFSDNITPAGYDRSLTGSGAKQRNVLTLRALNDEEAEGDWAYEGYSSDVDASQYYVNADTEGNEIDAKGNIFFAVAGDTPYSDVSSVAGGEDYFNPKTGELGYDFANEAILGTYLFQITGDGPITFEAADADNSVYGAYKGGKYIANSDEGIRSPQDCVTVATGTWPGAGKMTYFAEASQQEECTHEHTTTTYENVVDATCTEAGSRDVVVTCDDCGEEISRTNETLPAIGHDLGEWAETTAAVAPTCTEAGATAIETRTCSRCDYSETRGGEEVAALGHTYTEEVTAPTCTEAGYTTYTCTRCGDTYTEAGDPATGHTAAEAVRENEVGASCTEAGSYDSVVYCSVCGAEISRETVNVDALGHDLGEWTETTAAVAPTCTETGATAIETRTCSRCDYSETRGGEEVAALGHTAAEAVVENNVDPTCTEAGSYDSVVYCSVCGAEISRETVNVDALGHDLGEWAETTAAVAPTCTEAGATAIETRTCSRCDYSETRGGEEVAALGHTYAEEVTAPTCTEAGYTTYTCTRCGDTYTEAGDPATGHTAAEAVVENNVDPTCTEAGSYDSVVYCSVCGAEISRETVDVDALGHDFGEWQSAGEGVAPTCTTDGVDGGEIRYCSRCDATETRGGEVLPALGHDFVAGEVVAPTCTEAGYTVYECSRCDATENRDETAALGHDFGEWTVTTEPSCTEAGEETRYCSRCDETETRPVDALGHIYEAVVTEPTCTDGGYTTYTCARCGDTYTADATEALGHSYEAVVTEPTCTDGGYTTYTCSRCGDTYTADATEALGHDWGEWITTKEATEDEEGEAQRTCARCGEVETKAIPKADHVHVPAEAVEENRVEATCTEAGSYDLVVYCEKCGEEISRDAQTIDALGHDIVVDEAVAPTCTETGLTAGEHCSRCDYAVAQEEVPALGHDYQLTDHVDATRDAAGYDEYTCSRCGDSYQVEIPAIEGVKITTVITGEGEVEFSNNNIGMEDDGFLYTYGDQYKLTATPVDGYKFEGWYYGSRLLSTEKVYNNVAYVDLDVTAKFVEDAQEAFTVTFLGKYGDVKSEQLVTAGDQIEVPAPSDLPGYEFVAWTIDGAEVDEAAIKALTDSAVVQATYKKLTTGEFTITADGATITLPNGITNGSIPYDTKATVKFEGAESIVAVDANGAETVVATGDTYTFYVGSDIILKANTAEVADAVVTITSAKKDASSGKYNIIANRAVADGWTVKDRGFVCGYTNVVPENWDEIDLNNPATGIRVTHGTPTASKQFNYIVKIAAGKQVRFYAYIVIQKGNTTKVIHSDYVDVTGA